MRHDQDPYADQPERRGWMTPLAMLVIGGFLLSIITAIVGLTLYLQ